MSLLQDMKDYLVDQGVTERIMVLRMPDEEPQGATDIISLFQYGGDEPLFVPENPDIQYDRPRLQVLTRSDDPDIAGGIAHRVRQLLSRIVNMDINGHHYLRITPNGSPFLLQRDEAERTIWSANYRVWKDAENA